MTEGRKVIILPANVYKKFIKKKGLFISKSGKTISNHKFLEVLLERAKI